MRSAYHETDLYNLMVIKDAKNWQKHHLISTEQLTSISAAYPSKLFHPNFIIRVLLFIAGNFALSGVSGLFFLMVGFGDQGVAIACVIYGIVTFLFLKYVFIDKQHYKSGVTEALLYHAIGYTIGGLIFSGPINVHITFIVSILVATFAAIRYLDLISTIGATLTLATFVFYEFYELGGLLQKIIPFVMIAAFTPVYFITNRLKQKKHLYLWTNNLLVVESISLVLIYLAGNYLVVRELSINMMDSVIDEGQDIPFALIFYGLTVLIPIIYLFFGIRNKDIVMLRVCMIVIAFSVFTFKYYYNFGHPEITLTIAGAILLIIAMYLFHYLKTIRNGFTRENLLSEKWGNANVQAFVVSQTLGGNQVKTDDTFKGGGGEFGGGGASGSY